MNSFWRAFETEKGQLERLMWLEELRFIDIDPSRVSVMSSAKQVGLLLALFTTQFVIYDTGAFFTVPYIPLPIKIGTRHSLRSILVPSVLPPL